MLYLLWNLRKKNAEECYAINHVSLLPNKKTRLSEIIIKKKKKETSIQHSVDSSCSDLAKVRFCLPLLGDPKRKRSGGS